MTGANTQQGKVSEILHLYVLSAFAIAQPVFGLLISNVEFFVVRRSHSSDIYFLACVLLVLLPTALATVEIIAGFLHRKIRQYLHFLFVLCLAMLILLPLWKRLNDTADGLILGGALFCALIFCGFYAGSQRVRQFVSFLSLALVFFPLMFVYQSSSAFQLAGALEVQSESSNVPITVLILDELSITTLMDESKQIDSIRYPHFSALAQNSYWFRNATAVSDSTVEAVPAILTGRYPTAKKLLPISSNMPNNLFSFLHASHQINAVEKATLLCQPQICEPQSLPWLERVRSLLVDTYFVYLQIVLPNNLASRFPSVTQNWNNFNPSGSSETIDEGQMSVSVLRAMLTDDTKVFMHFVDSIVPTDKPGANIMHIVFPHIPFNHLPSGKKYNSKVGPDGLDMFKGKWNQDEWATRQYYQRYLLQLSYVDVLLGRLIKKLKESNLYDESLLVVVSDHGASYKTGDYRRELSATNYMDILPVVFMVKLPRQTTPVLSDRNVETIDVLPTIADAINRKIAFAVDGQSALDNSLPQREQKQAKNNKSGKVYIFPAILQENYQTLKEQVALFGVGSDDIFSFGPHQNMIGLPIAEIERISREDAALVIKNLEQYNNVDPTRKLIPARVLGQVVPPILQSPAYLAVAVNGIVRAITRTQMKSAGAINFTAVLPESSLVKGRNDIQAYFVADPKDSKLERSRDRMGSQ